jgi:DinB superfamily
MTDPRYPIGKFEPQPYSDKLRQQWIADIRFLPTSLENAVASLDAAQLLTPYRDGGWTVQQLVHHVADSHMNAYIRFKLGLTEDTPTIKPYEEKAWAELADTALPVNLSLTLLHALHARWVAVLDNIRAGDWEGRQVLHPGTGKLISLWSLLGMYSWHSRHHVAHITSIKW